MHICIYRKLTKMTRNKTSVGNTGLRSIGCLKLQVIFRKRTTNYRALLRKMTYKDKALYDSTLPCTKICQSLRALLLQKEREYINMYYLIQRESNQINIYIYACIHRKLTKTTHNRTSVGYTEISQPLLDCSVRPILLIECVMY